ncbi:hypothetical protein TEA_005571 [Camellia sinensis var. sinensis]|uniref:DC1 domain-containing protein n=2 Tax=Camellia sinensis TaxID=4442 RepID=A0A4S4EV54_CAMSN|nr:hypothetical protein TEA_005571 [Camellia sinensis var. sinensis]
MATRTKNSVPKHFLHKHALELNDKMEEYEVKCRVCKQGISDWQHYRWSDDFCTTRIHEYPCSEIPFQIDHHPLHPHHSSLFASSGSLHPNRSDVCGNSCEEAFKYKCIDCPFMLDVKCAPLTSTATKKIQFQKQQQQQPNHFHPLILCDMVKSFDYTCCCCGLSIDGDCVYVCLQCKGLLHNSCADLPLEIKHPFHSSHPLVLSQPLENKFFCCSVCDQLCCSKGVENHSLWKKVICSKLGLSVNNSWLVEIEILNKISKVWKGIAMNGLLKLESISKAVGNQGMKRQQKDKLLLKLHEYVLSMDNLLQFHVKLHEHIALVHDTQFGTHVAFEYESLVLTLKDFLDSFTEDENKEVQGLFEAYRRDVRGESGILSKILNPNTNLGFEKGYNYAHLDQVSAWIVKKYVSRVEVAMPWEKWDTTSKVIKDGHYMILENQISILKALFSKYTDFSIGSRLGTKATMLFVMTVCEAIHNMCNTKVMDITTSLLLTWFHSFAVAQYANFEILFVTDHLTKLVRAHVGFQVGHDVLVDLNLAEYIAQITKQHEGIDSKDIAIIEEDEESVDSEELTIIEEDEEIVDSKELAIIEEDKETVDSEELAIIEDKETHYLREKVDSMQLTIIKLDEAIKDLEKKKQALLKKREDWCIRKECLIDALELKGQMAGTSLL